jgi:hypothetical protein
MPFAHIQVGPDFLLDNRTGLNTPGYVAQFPRKLAVQDPHHAMALLESVVEDAGVDALKEAMDEAELIDLDAVVQALDASRTLIHSLSRITLPHEALAALAQIDLNLIGARMHLEPDRD